MYNHYVTFNLTSMCGFTPDLYYSSAGLGLYVSDCDLPIILNYAASAGPPLKVSLFSLNVILLGFMDNAHLKKGSLAGGKMPLSFRNIH